MIPHSRFHRFFYTLSHYFFSVPILAKYAFKTDKLKKIPGGGPAFVMSNHTTEVDMVALVNAMKPHIYFVCGEHLLRSKIGPTLKRLYNPIPEFKGTVAVKTIGEMLRRIREGFNIMIFPEGSRSFNGETLKLPVSIGKLVKVSHTALITYKIQGGYFVAPRWAYHFRKGKMSGHFVNIYTKEQISKMTPEEITNHINEDIYENAYETQRKQMLPYKCKGLAEGIENYLLICPECNSYDSFDSKGDEFWCTKCGAKGVYDKYGFLHGEKIHYDSVYDWGKWMEQKFDSDMEVKSNDELLFLEKNLTLYKVTPEHEQITLDCGDMKVFKNRLEICGKTFNFSEIEAMNMLYFGKTLLFTFDKINYGITGERFHAWKCNRLYDLQNLNKTEDDKH